MSTDLVQVKARIPRELKRQAFAAFALNEITFRQWLEAHLHAWMASSPSDGVAYQQLTHSTEPLC